MRNVSDIIENYLKRILEAEGQGHVEIKRSEIADKFKCVPSQINYVINTRFTEERGYMVESKRGGGGYIRIVRVQPHSQFDLIQAMIEQTTDQLTQTRAEDFIYRLIDEAVMTKREAKMVLAAINRTTLNVPLPLRDELRARILRAILMTIKYEKEGD
ncbi:transcriptional regulator [Lysinibacillus alkalisoli]|uniref:Transcriptional regulator CtsR n=1 Tax=Lysinibacillus alkalisoli TaxID=1911548 RepID=A0A917LJ06_9BACI|nr:CtsR family transcriptional regulator [Lysinibacillus alkalisoli]GGG28945.1 transcriptional regulator [Lysinibacillus alkalisoli]